MHAVLSLHDWYIKMRYVRMKIMCGSTGMRVSMKRKFHILLRLLFIPSSTSIYPPPPSQPSNRKKKEKGTPHECDENKEEWVRLKWKSSGGFVYMYAFNCKAFMDLARVFWGEMKLFSFGFYHFTQSRFLRWMLCCVYARVIFVYDFRFIFKARSKHKMSILLHYKKILSHFFPPYSSSSSSFFSLAWKISNEIPCEHHFHRGDVDKKKSEVSS